MDAEKTESLPGVAVMSLSLAQLILADAAASDDLGEIRTAIKQASDQIDAVLEHAREAAEGH